ncbi:DeoR/GlpR family DNA-binding transcription regulator [Mucilaginibacter daejeonensis]|uniref:DeoR/GlpR family DNA-binding transcription regulator n=1 Tax=Mucilaginibacter daejeonensis TaxID=398049 RepID=UPI001D176DAB|nr:DeoR/GlpR family DNA-binding transcription regulator [Mucilaginibacter daejeonensis]UEG51639.1 DeoR/GlpR family DNA-binding transcription regulator [Mucilaginibacter daejeonensis]
MLKEERHNFIIKQINLHNKVLSADLSVKLDVSEDTIRRDLNELAKSAKIKKVYGGAVSKSFLHTSTQNTTYAKEAKMQIAKKALTLIKEGMYVLLGGGTTILELARLVPKTLQCTFITISPLVALELIEYSTAEVILLGGRLLSDSYINTGSMVVNQLSEIQVDLCFLGANAIDIDKGITDSDLEVVQVKKAMLKSANRSVVLSISGKLDSTEKMTVCPMNSIEHLITELDPKDASLTRYADAVELM